MVSFTATKTLTVLVNALAALTAFTASAKPLLETPSTDVGLRNRATGMRIATQPKMVIYTDTYINKGGVNGLPNPDDLDGYNVLVLAFYLIKGPYDQAAAWQQLSSSQRKDLLKRYNDKGITVMMSSLGSTELPTTKGVDPIQFAKDNAAFVKKYDLAGVDVDYEDMTAMNKQNGKAEQWLIDYNTELRKQLPAGQFVISHAPVAPWFSYSSYKSGAYVTVHKKAGDDIDWYNLQFYNQGDSAYTDCNGLLHKGPSGFPKSSLFEINQYDAKVPLSKLVIGKPSQPGQAANGWMSFGKLASCVKEAGDKGWSAGTMFWEFESNLGNDLTNTLSKVVFNLVPGLDLGSGNDNGTPTSTTSAASPTETTPSGGGDDGDCDDGDDNGNGDDGSGDDNNNQNDSKDGGAEPWSSSKIYDGGSSVDSSAHTVSYEGCTYENKWWTQGDKPTDSDEWGVWKKLSCGSSKRDEPSTPVVVRQAASPARPVSSRRSASSPAAVIRAAIEERNKTNASEKRQVVKRGMMAHVKRAMGSPAHGIPESAKLWI